MPAPVLSICIPTYNRAPFLDYLLEAAAAWRFSFPHEIVISDNASTDETQAVIGKHVARGLPITAYRQSFNKGGQPNGLTVFHRARGDYVVYVGDDDLLIPEGIEAAMAVLRARPDLQVLYAPWQYFDAIAQQPRDQFFSIDQDIVFEPGQEFQLLDFLHKHHIFPEHMIYRADVVRSVLLDPPFCYWAFSYLAQAVLRGPVAFSKLPFYRSIVATPVQSDRVQAGTEQAMTDWDTYRGGLEYFVFAVLRKYGLSLNPEDQGSIRTLIDAFIARRMEVAVRLWLNRADYVCAHNLLLRLNFLDPAVVAHIPDVGRIQMLASCQILARFANGTAEVDRVVVVGADAIDPLRATLTAVGLREDIIVTPETDEPSAADLHGSVVFLIHEDDRQRVLDLGYAPGLVISERELNHGLHLVKQAA